MELNWRRGGRSCLSKLFFDNVANSVDEVDLCEHDSSNIPSSMCAGKYREEFCKKQADDDQIDLRDGPVEHREMVGDLFYKLDEVEHGYGER